MADGRTSAEVSGRQVPACHSSSDPAMNESPRELAAKLNLETGRLTWPELQPHFARGVVITVSTAVDLLEAAAALASDDGERVKHWMDDGRLLHAEDADARRWQDADAVFWAVVVAPWVLVQETTNRETE